MARGVVIQISGDPASAQKALHLVQEEMRETRERAEHEASAISEAWERVAGTLETVGLYMGVREAIESVKELVGGSVELGVELGHLHQQTGISTEDLSTLKYMSDKTGVGFEALTKSFKKFSTEMLGAEEGKKESISTFARLGITQEQVRQNSNDLYGMLGLVADRFKQIPDGPLKAAEAVGLFGKAGMSMIPILNQGRDGIAGFRAEAESLGLVLNQGAVEKLEQMHAAMVKLQGATKGAGLAFTEGLTPGVTQMLGVLNSGKSQMNAFEMFGHLVARGMAAGAAGVYALASGMENLFGIAEGGELTKWGSRDLAAARELNEKAEKFRDIALHGASPDDPPAEPGTGGGGGALHLGDQSGKGKSEDAIARARAELVAEQGRLVAAEQKMQDQLQLTELDAQHKELLVSDQEYFQEKLRLQNEEFDAEEKALKDRAAALQTLLKQQQGDKNAKRDKNGNSAEELKTQKDILQVQEQINAVQTRRGQASSANASEVVAASRAAELASLKIAAELEAQQNRSITARLALIQKETELKIKQSNAHGGTEQDAANIQASGKNEQDQLRLADINRQIEATLNDNKRATEEWNKAAASGNVSQTKAAKQISQLNQEAAKEVQGLVDQYYALAVTMGGPALEAAKNLKAQISEMSEPDKKDDAKFAKTLDAGLTSMADKIAQQAVRGKTSFRDMVKEMEADAVELAMKLAMLKLSKYFAGGDDNDSGGDGSGGGGGFWSSIFGALGEHHMSGGLSSGGAQVVGEAGPELWTPPSSGGTVTPANQLTKLAESSGGKAPNITTNVINQSSQPVSAQTSQVGFDSEMHQFVQHVVLTDLSSNGHIAQALRTSS